MLPCAQREKLLSSGTALCTQAQAGPGDKKLPLTEEGKRQGHTCPSPTEVATGASTALCPSDSVIAGR